VEWAVELQDERMIEVHSSSLCRSCHRYQGKGYRGSLWEFFPPGQILCTPSVVKLAYFPVKTDPSHHRRVFSLKKNGGVAIMLEISIEYCKV
jgi:hypothetical protein